jgi:putative transposase
MLHRWHHAPAHYVKDAGTYIVTGATLHKQLVFDTPERLDLLATNLFACIEEFGWTLHAWAIFANHYHFVAHSAANGDVAPLINKLHSITSRDLNRMDGAPGRKTLHQFWETRLTYEKSYFPRLGYVMHNPVKHGLVQDPVQYPWCSAGWFRAKASVGLQNTVDSFKFDSIKIKDDF